MLRCGFCISGAHDKCPGGIEHKGGLIWKCGCTSHPPVLRCLACGNTSPQEVDNQKYRCVDPYDCKDRATHRTDNNPVVVKIREIRMSTDTAEKTDKPKAKTQKVVKIGYCVHCNEPTKGGKFVAGHDARWISELVKAVLEEQVAEQSARAKVQQNGSAALLAKFDKSLSSQRGKKARQKLAEEEAAAGDLAADEAAALDADAPDDEEVGEADEVDDDDIDDEDDEDDDEDEPEAIAAPEPVKTAPARRATGLKRAVAPAADKPAVRRKVGTTK